jgi:beta-fructofuranosidase
VEAVEQAFLPGVPAVYQSLNGSWEQKGDSLTCASDGQFSCVLAQSLPEICRVKTTLRYSGKPAQFGVALHMDETFSDGYYLAFEPNFRRVQYKSGLRMNEEGGKMFPYAVEMERPLVLEPEKDYEIEIYIQDTVGLMYVNRDLAFSFRMYHNGKGSRLGFFASEGILEVCNTEIETEQR